MNDGERMAEAERLARRFHEAYERLAPSFGYETRKASAKPWNEVPEQNRRLMVAVCAELLSGSAARLPGEPSEEAVSEAVRVWRYSDEQSPSEKMRESLATAYAIDGVPSPGAGARTEGTGMHDAAMRIPREFGYLLNAMEAAAHAENSAKAGYAAKRQAVFAFVQNLALRAAHTPARDDG